MLNRCATIRQYSVRSIYKRTKFIFSNLNQNRKKSTVRYSLWDSLILFITIHSSSSSCSEHNSLTYTFNNVPTFNLFSSYVIQIVNKLKWHATKPLTWFKRIFVVLVSHFCLFTKTLLRRIGNFFNSRYFETVDPDTTTGFNINVRSLSRFNHNFGRNR